jgi:hypothetical protein
LRTDLHNAWKSDALADLAGRSVTTSVAAHQGDAVATEQAS